MYFAGIDPGAAAGFALITGPETVITVACKNNIEDAFEILRKLDPTKVIVGLEHLHALWGVSSRSTFMLGAAWGGWKMLLEFLHLSVIDIKVQEWQSKVVNLPERPNVKGLSQSEVRKAKKYHKDLIKMESFRAATEAFPKVRFPSHDVTDAVNIARYVQMYGGKLMCNKKVKNETKRKKGKDESSEDCI